MKWAVAQLKKLSKPSEFEYDYDFFANLTNKLDIIACKKCHVTGTLIEPELDVFEFNVHISLELVRACAVTLEDVEASYEFDTEFRFSYDDDDSSDCYIIEKNTVNLDEAIQSEIITNLPYRVVKEGCEDLIQKDEDYEEETPDYEALNNF